MKKWVKEAMMYVAIGSGPLVVGTSVIKGLEHAFKKDPIEAVKKLLK